MNHVEDEDVDDFLYGDSSTNKVERSETADNEKESGKAKINEEEEEEDELYGLYRGDADNEKEEFIVNDAQDQRDDDGNDDEQSDANEDDDSDDDLEIILEADDAEQPAESSQNNGNQDATGKNSLVNIKPNATGKPATNTQQQDGALSSAKPAAGGIDLEAVGQLDGKPITDVELDSFEDKPWRKPGADITDYFNYGFNEASWRAYCNKQKMLREGKGKMMGNMDIPPEMAMGMMMPPMMDGGMPGMPPNPMMGMPMGIPMNMPPGGGNPNFRGGRSNAPAQHQGQGGPGRNNNRGGMSMGRMHGSQEGGNDDKSNVPDHGDGFNGEEHMNFPMNFPGAPPMGMFPPDMGPGGTMGGMPPFFNPNMAGPGGQGFDGPGPNRGNQMMMRGGGPMRPPRGRGSPVPGDHGGANNDPRKRMIPPDDDAYNKRPRNR